MNKNLHPILYCLISVLLLSIGWYPFSFVWASFFAFVPLFILEARLRNHSKSTLVIVGYSFLTFLLWNIATTWWLTNATAEGAFAAFIINAGLMCLPVLVYHWAQKRSTSKQAEWIFIFAWLSFEYLHHTWEFSWPWLSLGNVFSTTPILIQWYEYTGVVGGSFWILLTNRFVYRLWTHWPMNSKQRNLSRSFNLVFFVGFAPIFLSLFVLKNYQATGIPIKVAVVQPNIDPYKDKFNGLNPKEQTRKMTSQALTVLDSSIQLVCFPETALLEGLDESWINNTEHAYEIRKSLLAKYPQLSILTGAETYSMYHTEEERTFTARKYNDQLYYDSYNTALLFNKEDSIQVYHKSKLVPGVEALPYQQYLGFMTKLTIDLGGTSGSLGRSKEASNFYLGRNQWVAPVICYESVFGEYVSDYVKKGAGLLCVITNDGWWGNTPGHRHHFDYARLRAIETRRYVARAANTGISGFIDDKGNVISETKWWTQDAQQAKLQYLTRITFYVQYAHYIELIPVLLLLMALFRMRK